MVSATGIMYEFDIFAIGTIRLSPLLCPAAHRPQWQLSILLLSTLIWTIHRNLCENSRTHKQNSFRPSSSRQSHPLLVYPPTDNLAFSIHNHIFFLHKSFAIRTFFNSGENGLGEFAVADVNVFTDRDFDCLHLSS